jgi:uncharacterized membrane protein (Fun14 family)
MNNTSTEATIPSDIFSKEYLIGNVGTPFVIGFAVGYFAKKMLFISVLLCGALIVLLFVSEYFNITHINDVNLQHAVDSATDAAKESGNFLVNRLSKITSKGISATGGFFVGFKLG